MTPLFPFFMLLRNENQAYSDRKPKFLKHQIRQIREPRNRILLVFTFYTSQKNHAKYLFLKISLNTFFDVSEANFNLSRRNRPRYFPRLKTKITGFRKNCLYRSVSSQGAIFIEKQNHFCDPPVKPVHQYNKPLNTPAPTANPVSKLETDFLFIPKTEIDLSTEQKQTDLQRQKSPDFRLEKCPKMGD